MFYEQTVLSNGITIITEKMDSVRSITLGLWFRVGSRDESPHEAGMSHFMEHMMFKGTPTRDFIEISSQFEALGAELNAFTSREYTCYYARFVDDKLTSAMEILGDMVVNSLFAQECIDSEREVVIEEIARSEDAPEDYVFDLFTDAMFPTHPIGRPVIGTRAIVGGFMHDDCRAYHDKYYNTNNLVVVATGNVDHAAFVSLCEKEFAHLSTGAATARPLLPPEQALSHAFLKKDTEQAHILYGMPSLPSNHPDRFAASLLDCALGGGMSSRLFQEIRERRGLAYSVYCSTSSFIGVGQFAIYVGTRPTNIEQVYEILLNECAKVKEQGITEAELARVRDFATGQIILSMEETRNRMIRLGKNAIVGSDLLSLEETIESYRNVSLDDIARLAAELFSRDTTLAIISPREEEELEEKLLS